MIKVILTDSEIDLIEITIKQYIENYNYPRKTSREQEWDYIHSDSQVDDSSMFDFRVPDEYEIAFDEEQNRFDRKVEIVNYIGILNNQISLVDVDLYKLLDYEFEANRKILFNSIKQHSLNIDSLLKFQVCKYLKQISFNTVEPNKKQLKEDLINILLKENLTQIVKGKFNIFFAYFYFNKFHKIKKLYYKDLLSKFENYGYNGRAVYNQLLRFEKEELEEFRVKNHEKIEQINSMIDT
jgi:hypothetical protein